MATLEEHRSDLGQAPVDVYSGHHAAQGVTRRVACSSCAGEHKDTILLIPTRLSTFSCVLPRLLHERMATHGCYTREKNLGVLKLYVAQVENIAMPIRAHWEAKVYSNYSTASSIPSSREEKEISPCCSSLRSFRCDVEISLAFPSVPATFPSLPFVMCTSPLFSPNMTASGSMSRPDYSVSAMPDRNSLNKLSC